MKKKPKSKSKTKMPPRWALISLGVVLFLIAGGCGLYFIAGHLLTQSTTTSSHTTTQPPNTITPPDTTPPLISNITFAGYTGETATINWETDEEAIGQVEYGISDAYGKLVTSDAKLTTSHSVELTGLQPNTTYHFRVRSTDKSGNQIGSGDQAFTNWVAEKDWAKYVNKEYGFSIQYPSDWVARPELISRSTYYYLAVFSVNYFVPALCVAAFDADQPISADWAVETYKKMDDKDIKVVSPLTETTLSDSTQATTYKIKYVPLHMPNQAEDYEYTAYCLDTDRGGKRIHIWVSTVEMWVPYNEALFSQIAHTLRFSAK
jgi:hypothetical protein